MILFNLLTENPQYLFFQAQVVVLSTRFTRSKEKKIKSIDVKIVLAGKTGLKLKYTNEMRKNTRRRHF